MDYRKVGINMKKKNRSVAKHVKSKNKSIVTSGEVAAKEEVNTKPEVTPVYISREALDVVAKKNELLMLPKDEVIYQYMHEVVALRKQLAHNEKMLVSEVIRDFNESIIGFSDIAQQVEIVKSNMQDLNTLSGLLNVLKIFEDDRTYRNPATGYKMPLDERISNLAGEVYEYLSVMFDREDDKSKKQSSEESIKANSIVLN